MPGSAFKFFSLTKDYFEEEITALEIKSREERSWSLFQFE